MISSSNSRAIGFGMMFIASFLSGCDEDWAKELDTGGKTVPDARLRVILKQPVASHQLFDRIDKLATRAGFPDRRSAFPPIVAGDPKVEGAYHGWSWHPTKLSSMSSSTRDYQIGISWEETLSEPAFFDFILHSNSTGEPTETEWALFERWKGDYFRSEFPDAKIIVVRHFAEFNTCESTSKISAKTRIPVPEKTTVKCEWWSSKEPNE